MYYKHKNIDSYVMVTPTKVVKLYRDAIVQYLTTDYFFKIESEVNTDHFKPIPEHEFRFAFIQVLETLTFTLNTLNHAEVSIN
jgi:hypothetical protein